MLTILGVDPGETTGVFLIKLNQTTVVSLMFHEFNKIEFYDFMDGIHSHIGINDEFVIVCETFLITPKTGQNSQAPWSLRISGVCEYFAQKWNARYYGYAPSAAKNLITNDVIKFAGWWKPGKGHAMDAVRQALYFLFTEKKILTEFLRGPNANL